MAEQVKEDPSKYYWTEQDIQEGTIEKPTLVTPTRSFYLNKEHQLVLTFLNTKLLLVIWVHQNLSFLSP